MELIEHLIYREQRSDAELLRRAFLAAQRSPDPSTQVGALVASGVDRPVATGWNHPVAAEGEGRDEKLASTVHAELAALLCAARNGIPTRGATLYCTWACCRPCANAIVEAGIARVVTSELCLNATPSRWSEPVLDGLATLRRSGVVVHALGHAFGSITIRFDRWFLAA